MKHYSISDISKMFGINPSKIRYYETVGIIPKIKKKNNKRYFTEENLEFIKVIFCLKKTGMSLVKIKEYVDLCKIGNDSIEKRYEIILNQKNDIIKQIEELKECLNFIKYKEKLYQEMMEVE